MGEIFLENEAAEQTDEEKERKISDIIRSLEYRNPFEVLVFEILDIEDDVEQVAKYGKLIRDFIDNPENTEVRSLIVQKKFKEAAELTVSEIRQEKF